MSPGGGGSGEGRGCPIPPALWRHFRALRAPPPPAPAGAHPRPHPQPQEPGKHLPSAAAEGGGCSGGTQRALGPYSGTTAGGVTSAPLRNMAEPSRFLRRASAILASGRVGGELPCRPPGEKEIFFFLKKGVINLTARGDGYLCCIYQIKQ